MASGITPPGPSPATATSSRRAWWTPRQPFACRRGHAPCWVLASVSALRPIRRWAWPWLSPRRSARPPSTGFDACGLDSRRGSRQDALGALWTIVDSGSHDRPILLVAEVGPEDGALLMTLWQLTRPGGGLPVAVLAGMNGPQDITVDCPSWGRSAQLAREMEAQDKVDWWRRRCRLRTSADGWVRPRTTSRRCSWRAARATTRWPDSSGPPGWRLASFSDRRAAGGRRIASRRCSTT